MKIDIKIEGGFNLSPAEQDRLMREAMEEVAASARLEYCAEHKQRATARVVRQGSELGIEIEGCCDDLIQRAQQRIAP